MTDLAVTIAIPTYDRSGCIGRAIDAALGQSHVGCRVLVVDDGSRDDTPRVTRAYATEPRFACIRLGRNVGTAQAKNVALLCADYEAITFHDSDDTPSPDKVLLQVRAMAQRGLVADHILHWAPFGHRPGSTLEVDVVVGGYDLVKLDGSVHYIQKRVSLLDDFFPNAQFPAKTEGDWCLINCGLFRRRVFERLGGFLDSIEEDRELRNRALAAGAVWWFVDRPLLTKIEMGDSLTMMQDTGYRGRVRRDDRDEVWRRVDRIRTGLLGERAARELAVTIDLSAVVVEDVIGATTLRYQDGIAVTPGTRERLAALCGVSDGAEEAAHG